MEGFFSPAKGFWLSYVSLSIIVVLYVALATQHTELRMTAQQTWRSLLSHEVLDVLWMIRDAVLAEEAAAVGCYEDVVLDADAAKVLVGLQ